MVEKAFDLNHESKHSSQKYSKKIRKNFPANGRWTARICLKIFCIFSFKISWGFFEIYSAKKTSNVQKNFVLYEFFQPIVFPMFLHLSLPHQNHDKSCLSPLDFRAGFALLDEDNLPEWGMNHPLEPLSLLPFSPRNRGNSQLNRLLTWLTSFSLAPSPIKILRHVSVCWLLELNPNPLKTGDLLPSSSSCACLSWLHTQTSHHHPIKSPRL